MPEKPDSYAAHTTLGQSVSYSEDYNPQLLQAIPRAAYRATLQGDWHTHGADQGVDLWRSYELSWLNLRGKPENRLLQMAVPASSDTIVESKSLKLYLNSLNNHRLDSEAALLALLHNDLQHCLGCAVRIELASVSNSFAAFGAAVSAESQLEGRLIDTLDVECKDFERNADLLTVQRASVENQKFVSHALRSLCPVTQQPDWATVTVQFSGRALDPASLLQYIVSYRNHLGFHEQCIEQMFVDLRQLGCFDKLTVTGQFTRRGGIDISPCRSTEADCLNEARVNRQ